MRRINIRLADLPHHVALLNHDLQDAMKRGHMLTAQQARTLAIQATPVNSTQARTSWTIIETVGGFTVENTAFYAGILEMGSRPHMPPLEPLRDWVDSHLSQQIRAQVNEVKQRLKPVLKEANKKIRAYNNMQKKRAQQNPQAGFKPLSKGAAKRFRERKMAESVDRVVRQMAAEKRGRKPKASSTSAHTPKELKGSGVPRRKKAPIQSELRQAMVNHLNYSSENRQTHYTLSDSTKRNERLLRKSRSYQIIYQAIRNQIVFQIAQAIKRRGTKPHHIIKKNWQTIIELNRRYVATEVHKTLREHARRLG